MDRNIEYRSDRYLCTVTNSFEGRLTVLTLRKAGLKFRVRGRHPDRKGLFKSLKHLGIYPNHCNDVPTQYAMTWALYLVEHKCSSCDYRKSLKDRNF